MYLGLNKKMSMHCDSFIFANYNHYYQIHFIEKKIPLIHTHAFSLLHIIASNPVHIWIHVLLIQFTTTVFNFKKLKML